MADSSQVLADTLPFTAGGKTYTVEEPNEGTRADHARFIAEQAIAFVRKNKRLYGEDYLAVYERITCKAAAGGFRFMGAAWWDAVQAHDANWQELAYLVLKQKHPEVTKAEIVAWWNDEGGVVLNDATKEDEPTVKGGELVDKIIRLASRPNSHRPA